MSTKLVKVSLDQTGDLNERSYNAEWLIELTTPTGPVGVWDHSRVHGPDKVPFWKGVEYKQHVHGVLQSDFSAYWRGATYEPVDDSFTIWTAKGSWKTMKRGETPEDNTSDPLRRRTKYHWEFENVTEPAEDGYCMGYLPSIGRGVAPLDQTGDLALVGEQTKGPIVNSTGVEFDTPLMIEKRRAILVMQKNFPDELYPLNLVNAYDNTLNSSVYRGFPMDHAKFVGVEATQLQEENKVKFITVTVRILLSREPLYRRPVNRGFSYLMAKKHGEETLVCRIPALDAETLQPYSEPVLLSAAGGLVGGPADVFIPGQPAGPDLNDPENPPSVEDFGCAIGSVPGQSAGQVGNVIPYRLEERADYTELLW